MATLRTMHKRRKRKLMIAAQPCVHRTVREYADGEYCQRCGAWFEMDFWKDEYVEPEWDDWDDDDGYCETCGGEGRIIDCLDDLCQDGCIHGDGERACPDCDNWM